MSEFVTKVMRETKTPQKEIDEIYDAIDSLMKAGCWVFLDDCLFARTSSAWRTGIDKLLAYVTATLPAKIRLPSRKDLLVKCRELHPNPELWKGLD